MKNFDSLYYKNKVNKDHKPPIDISAALALNRNNTQRAFIIANQTPDDERLGGRTPHYDNTKAVSDYIYANRKRFMLTQSFSENSFMALKFYEVLYAPLEKDGRKGISYESTKVDSGGGGEQAINLMAQKETAILKIKTVHDWLDAFIDPQSKKRLSESDMAYSHVIRLVCEGFWHNLNCVEILKKIGITGRNTQNAIEDDERRGAFMVVTSAWVLSKYFEEKKQSVGKEIGIEREGRYSFDYRKKIHKNASPSIGEMNYSDMEIAQSKIYSDEALTRRAERNARHENQLENV